MTMKLGMEHYLLKFYKVYINDDPELTLTQFTTMSNLAKIVFVLIVGPDIRWAFTGPLVFWFYYYKRIMVKLGNVVPCKYVLASSLANFDMKNHFLSSNLLADTTSNLLADTKYRTTFAQSTVPLGRNLACIKLD